MTLIVTLPIWNRQRFLVQKGGGVYAPKRHLSLSPLGRHDHSHLSKGGSGLGEKKQTKGPGSLRSRQQSAPPSAWCRPGRDLDVGLNCVNGTELGWGETVGVSEFVLLFPWSVMFHHERGLLLSCIPQTHITGLNKELLERSRLMLTLPYKVCQARLTLGVTAD